MFSKKNYQEETSFPEMSYPSLRDGGLQTSEQWLEGKRLDDGAEGLWRVHDKLYDFSSFISTHPGGESWLRLTKGTDITEAFESHHLSTIPENMLKTYYVRSASSKRHSPFTFKEDGFYRTLKRRAREVVKTLPKNKAEKSKRIMEGLVIGMFTFSIVSCYSTNILVKIMCCIIAGLLMTWIPICAHNFAHQKDNWRMYLFNFNMSQVREWRITHGLSHHLFPNTLLDFEITSMEPFILYLPRKSKTWLERYGPRFTFMIISLFIYDAYVLKLLLKAYSSKDIHTFKRDDLIPFTLPLAMFILSYASLTEVLITWIVIWHISSIIYNCIGLNAAHHHPDIFHDGDEPREDRDWGLHQLEAVMDRVDINKSYFAVLTNYGEHGLHHMFPTLDHAYLSSLHNVFYKTCLEFKTQLKMNTQLGLVIGQFEQIARLECKKRIKDKRI